METQEPSTKRAKLDEQVVSAEIKQTDELKKPAADVAQTEVNVSLTSTQCDTSNQSQETRSHKPPNGQSIESAKVVSKQKSDDDVKMSRPLTENDVGIRCYITTGFTPVPGVIKQRFSDFVVNEISTNGETVRLTSTDLPLSEEEVEKTQDQEGTTKPNTEETTNAAGEITQSTDAAGETTVPGNTEMADTKVEEKTPISQDEVAELEKIANGSSEKKHVKILAPKEKSERKDIHLFIKTRFPSLCSNCVEEDGVKYLEISLYNKKSDRRSQQHSWPKDRPQHLHFVLYKEFKDTMEALDIISKYSNIRAQQFQYAGTKDKRAKTSQRVSVHKVTAEKLRGTNKKLWGMKLGNFQYKHERIGLGQLAGNHFKIVLRNVSSTAENLQKATDALSSDGFINYFGMQRFGTTNIPTYEIGKLLLKGELLQAIDLIMSPRGSERSDVEKARSLWKESRNAKQVLDKLPKSLNIERRLMQGIIRSGLDKLQSAMENIPRTTRLLYLHSYQSLIWNRLASQRIEKYGLEPIVGDLVYDRSASSTTTPTTTDQGLPPLSAEDRQDTDKDKEETQINKSAVRHLTAADLEKYTIYDVLMPLPGFNVQLPNNEVKDWMTSMLSEDNLSIADLKTKQKDYRLPGSYRHLLVLPKNVTAALRYYDEVTEELVQSDLDILDNKVAEYKQSGAYEAACIEFSLPSSCYATMLLRELMRTDTSANQQAKLNVT